MASLRSVGLFGWWGSGISPEDVPVLSITTIDHQSLNIEFSFLQFTEYFDLYRSTSPNSGFVQINSEPIQSWSYVDSDLSTNTYYYYYAVAWAGVNHSGNSLIYSGKTASDGTIDPSTESVGTPKVELYKGKVERLSVEFLRLSWIIKPTAENLNDYHFIILRSNSPEGQYDLVKRLQNKFHYDDFEVINKSEYRIYYYKIRISNNAGDYKDYGPYWLTADPDKLVLEMIRKKHVALYFGSTPGVDIKVFVRKTFGQYCPVCFDVVKKRRSMSNCTSCLNTNFLGGYFEPVDTRAFFGVSQKQIQSLGFEVHPDRDVLELPNYPLVSPGDIIRQNNIKNMRVLRVETRERGSYIVSQFIQCEACNPSDIEYELGGVL